MRNTKNTWKGYLQLNGDGESIFAEQEFEISAELFGEINAYIDEHMVERLSREEYDFPMPSRYSHIQHRPHRPHWHATGPPRELPGDPR